MMNKTRRKKLDTVLTYVILILLAAFIVIPVLWMLSTAFKTEAQTYYPNPKWLPDPFSLESFHKFFNTYNFGKMTVNSLITCLAAMVICVACACLAGYGITRFKFKGRKQLLNFLLITQMFPSVMLVVPFYAVLSKYHLTNTLLGLIVVYAATMEEGYRYIRCHMGTYGGNFGGRCQSIVKPENAPEGAYFDPRMYMNSVYHLFDRVRADIGWGVEVMHDVHERLSLAQTIEFAKELEQYKLFFLEDSLAPEYDEFFKTLREHTTLPLAMGELFTNPAEWKPLVQNQWIDFIRVHLSDIGGITPARKLAHYCEAYGVRTAWHGPNDLSPIGMAAQMHLDLNCHNFGIQEFSGFSEEEQAVFPGCPVVKNGYAYVNDKPGIGVDFDEKEALKYPEVQMDHSWLFSRLPDGTPVRP